jgi:hypothetical protein
LVVWKFDGQRPDFFNCPEIISAYDPMNLLELLRKSETGRHLLRKDGDFDLRLIRSGAEALPDRVTVKQVHNRLNDLLVRLARSFGLARLRCSRRSSIGPRSGDWPGCSARQCCSTA